MKQNDTVFFSIFLVNLIFVLLKSLTSEKCSLNYIKAYWHREKNHSLLNVLKTIVQKYIGYNQLGIMSTN